MELVTAAVEGGHRILLFSQFTSMLDLLAQRLDAVSYTHLSSIWMRPATAVSP